MQDLHPYNPKVAIGNAVDEVSIAKAVPYPSGSERGRSLIDRSFGSQQSLDQHLNSPAHAPVFECDDCDRAFGSQRSLDQQLNSAAHAPLYKCDECDRWFGSPQALQRAQIRPCLEERGAKTRVDLIIEMSGQ
jgi:hypothetical protein